MLEFGKDCGPSAQLEWYQVDRDNAQVRYLPDGLPQNVNDITVKEDDGASPGAIGRIAVVDTPTSGGQTSTGAFYGPIGRKKWLVVGRVRWKKGVSPCVVAKVVDLALGRVTDATNKEVPGREVPWNPPYK